MGRKRQGGARRNQIATDDISLHDALGATQQHTLPVLPANAPGSPDASPGGSSGATRSPSASSRMPRRTLGDATGAQTRVTHTPRPPRGATSPRYLLPDLDTVAAPSRAPAPAPSPASSWDEPLAATPVDELLHQPAPSPADSFAGRPSRSLPSLGDAQLPVPVTPGERSLAPANAGGESSAVLIKGSGSARPSAFRIVPRRHGPRSFVSQFFAGMVMVMLLVSVLTLASPLGRGTVFAGAFQGYANAVPWVPTPTPRPPTPTPYVPPPGANPGQQAIINDIVSIFGSYAQGAINVARCESGFDPNAWNPYAIGNSHAEGVFQILYPSTWSTTSYAGYSPYSYDANIRAAHELFTRDGNSWREWACQP
ncbi:MAG TPA: hypothetical protein VJQ45_06995 [Ktedonobacterales bacterium]|nr:hypothetical protein [Ktedonobacterales bacterium]